MNEIQELLRSISISLDGRPVRWASIHAGDFDGRERTLEIFNADASDQRESMRKIRPLRLQLESLAGGPVVVVFHTRLQSERLYADFIEEALRAELATDIDRANLDRLDEFTPLATDVRLRQRIDDQPGTGSSSLPRKAA